jgi:hypothetical protein
VHEGRRVHVVVNVCNVDRFVWAGYTSLVNFLPLFAAAARQDITGLRFIQDELRGDYVHRRPLFYQILTDLTPTGSTTPYQTPFSPQTRKRYAPSFDGDTARWTTHLDVAADPAGSEMRIPARPCGRTTASGDVHTDMNPK